MLMYSFWLLSVLDTVGMFSGYLKPMVIAFRLHESQRSL